MKNNTRKYSINSTYALTFKKKINIWMEGGDIRMNCLKDHNPLQTPFHSVRCLELIVSFFAFAKYGDFQDLNYTYNKKISYEKKLTGVWVATMLKHVSTPKTWKSLNNLNYISDSKWHNYNNSIVIIVISMTVAFGELKL